MGKEPTSRRRRPSLAEWLAAAVLASPLSMAAPALGQEAEEAPPPLHPPGIAAPAPRCDAAHEGVTACFANVLCVCRFRPGDAARRLPDRFAWDCGLKRPQCRLPPADLAPFGVYGAPPVIVDLNRPPAGRAEPDHDRGDEARQPDAAAPQA